MSYPTAYRKAAQEYDGSGRKPGSGGGFQPAPKPSDIPSPANDNFQAPKPANDNFPGVKLPSPEDIARKGAEWALKFLLRNNPYYRAFEILKFLLRQLPDKPSVWKDNWRQLPDLDKVGYECPAGSSGGTRKATGGTDCRTSYGFFWGPTFAGPSVPDSVAPDGVGVMWNRWLYWEYWQALPYPTAPIYRGYIVGAGYVDMLPLRGANWNSYPVVAPAIAPEPWPVWLVPYRQDSPLRETGPKPRARPEPSPSPYPLEVADGSAGPSFVVEVGPQGVSGRLAPPVFVPRGPRRNERKGMLALDKKSLGLRVFSDMTEAFDVISAIYEAIPEDVRGKRRRSPTNKVAFIFTHWRDVDVENAIVNLIKNEIEDRLIGAAGKQLSKFAREQGLPHGVQMGGFVRKAPPVHRS